MLENVKNEKKMLEWIKAVLGIISVEKCKFNLTFNMKLINLKNKMWNKACVKCVYKTYVI